MSGRSGTRRGAKSAAVRAEAAKDGHGKDGQSTNSPDRPTDRASGLIEAPAQRRRVRPFATDEAARAWLEGLTNFERVRPSRMDPESFRLDRMRALLAELGDPHAAVRWAHVAGSKGKGSTCEMLASCLRACGYTVGLTTSPHLVDVRERVRINGEMISTQDMTRLLARCRHAADAVAPRHGEATYFEVVTLLAMVHFAEQAVDIAVAEVGMGGRLDSTNVITPEVCGLTAIQLEHTAILGDTLEKIAAEKAGIMKPGVPCVSVKQDKGVLEVFRQTAERVGCDLSVLGKEIEFTTRFESSHDLGPHTRVCVQAKGGGGYEHLPVPLPGEHQAANCGLALAMLEKLRQRGFKAPERDVATGLAATPRHGRVETVLERPRIVIDGAHTGESVGALVKAIGSSIRYDSMVMIFGCAGDKNIDKMLEEVGRGADKVIFTKASHNARAADPKMLAQRFEDLTGKMSQVEPTVRDAINVAARAVARDDLICITGSFYLAGEAKALLLARHAAAGAAASPAAHAETARR